MDDIVEKLRRRAQNMNGARQVGGGDGNTYVPANYDRAAQADDAEAADLIESLRSDNARLAKELEEARKALDLSALRRNCTLRDALGKISSPTQTEGLLWWQVEARAALDATETTVTTDDLPEGGSET